MGTQCEAWEVRAVGLLLAHALRGLWRGFVFTICYQALPPLVIIGVCTFVVRNLSVLGYNFYAVYGPLRSSPGDENATREGHDYFVVLVVCSSYLVYPEWWSLIVGCEYQRGSSAPPPP